MSEPQRIIIERGVAATMRDGTVLLADVYRPADDRRYPVLLQRNPYSKSYLPFVIADMDPVAAAMQGYVVAVQDVRGRWASGGDRFYAYRDEYEDGYDSVEWAAQLPYADGNVGMWGMSYMGGTQWQAATTRPPSLKAIFPSTSGGDVFFRRGGALEWGLLAYWSLAALGPHALARAKLGTPEFLAEFAQLVATIDGIDRAYATLPLRAVEAFDLGHRLGEWVDDVLAHDTYDDYHDRVGVTRKLEQVQVPAFILAGWYDALLGPNLEHFARVHASGQAPGTRLMIGPWAHASFAPAVGERDFGLAASGVLLELQYSLTDLHLRWFDQWLKGAEQAEQPAVKIFVMGENRWRAEDDWPLARAQPTPWYLHSGGHANSLHGDGTLSPQPPAVDESWDHFVFDPRDPVPTRGGNILMPGNYIRGPVDQRRVEERADVLVYTSAPLTHDLEVTGPLSVTLHAATSAPDTDFTAKLVEVLPDGTAYNVADGIIRARYRNGPDVAPSPITPGQPVAYVIDLVATSILFRAGHRIRLEISSSNFPRFDRNPNTGRNSSDAGELVPALQTVFHDAVRASHILLPVVPR